MLEPQEPPTMDIPQKRKPTWVREIIQEEEIYGEPNGSTRTNKISNPYSSYVALMCDHVDQEPTSYVLILFYVWFSIKALNSLNFPKHFTLILQGVYPSIS